MKPHGSDEIDMEDGKLEKDREKQIRSNKVVKIHNQALLSCLAYCFASCSMILVNKFVLSSYNFNAGISLMLYQVWLPVNVIFVGMLVTSMFSLKYINVAMVTVLKNVTNVITAVGEMYLFNKYHDNRVWAALFLMIISAISGGITDLSFHAVGYMWQIVNCFLTASYSLTLRRVMDTAKQVTKSGDLNEFSMVLLNNALSLPLGILLIFVFNEATFEVAHLLVGDDIKWVFGPGNKLQFYVVPASNWGYHLQVFWLECSLLEPKFRRDHSRNLERPSQIAPTQSAT
ncbi:hypothetical protein RJ641_011120, partial [Dillenia turbinata]